VDPSLAHVSDPVPLLQVYAHRYRTGQASTSRRPVRSGTVAAALQGIAQTFLGLGAPDPRLDYHGNIDYRLRRQMASYGKDDPPPHRVKPIPISILQHIAFVAQASQDPRHATIADMITIAFYFLLRPGEYTGSSSGAHPFRLADVQLFSQGRRLSLALATDDTIRSSQFATLTFTSQKNGVRGEVIGQARSGHPYFCPVIALINRVIHLRHHQAPLTTPLATTIGPTGPIQVTPSDISTTLQFATTILGPPLGLKPEDISARSLRASGAMALLCAQVDGNIIQLIGRWKSDAMLRYLHVQAEPVMRDFASRMLANGSYSLHPNETVPTH